MKDILTAPFVEEMKKATANMYRLGWDERNGGNISYMLDNDEVGEYLDRDDTYLQLFSAFLLQRELLKYLSYSFHQHFLFIFFYFCYIIFFNIFTSKIFIPDITKGSCF